VEPPGVEAACSASPFCESLPRSPFCGGTALARRARSDYSTAEQERTYNKVAERVARKELIQLASVRDLGIAEYDQKRAVYQQSGFAITRKLGNENAEWKPERIAAVQNWMATQATAVWRIAQLG
jgi:hypothetical protein